MNESQLPDILVDKRGDRWCPMSDGSYALLLGDLHCDNLDELERLYGPLAKPGKESLEDEQPKVLLDKDGDEWFLQDDGKYEWNKGYLRYSLVTLDRNFSPLTEPVDNTPEEDEPQEPHTVTVTISCDLCGENVSRKVALSNVSTDARTINLVPLDRSAGEEVHRCKPKKIDEPPVGRAVLVDGEEFIRIDRQFHDEYRWLAPRAGAYGLSFHTWPELCEKGDPMLLESGDGW